MVKFAYLSSLAALGDREAAAMRPWFKWVGIAPKGIPNECR